MTLAICLKCGTRKHGAWITCPSCGFTPESNEDQARALLLTDHNYNQEQLQEIGAAIANGVPPDFNEEQIAEIAKGVGDSELPVGCKIAVWIPIVVLIVLVALVFWLWITGAYSEA